MDAAHQCGPVLVELVGEANRAEHAVGLCAVAKLQAGVGLEVGVGGVFQRAGVGHRLIGDRPGKGVDAFGRGIEPETFSQLPAAAQTKSGLGSAAIDGVARAVFAEHFLVFGDIGVDADHGGVVALHRVERERA